MPLMPQLPRCSCLSPLARTSTRWRFTFEGSRTVPALDKLVPTTTTFTYKLQVAPQSSACRDITYRNGNCCNQTLSGISLAVRDEAKAMLKHVNISDWRGKRVPDWTWNNASYGVRIDFKTPIYVDSMTSAQWYEFDVGFDAAYWPDLGSFPCPASAYAAGDNACDYWFQGYQTKLGKPREMLGDSGALVPGCCPEGVLFYAQSPPTMYKVSISDSPYSLRYVTGGQNAGITTLQFQVVYQGGSASGACKAMSIEYIQLFFEDNLQDAIAGITLAGLSVKWQLGYIAALPYANITTSGYVSVANQPLIISLRGSFTIADFCSTPYGGGRACGYKLAGSAVPGANDMLCCPSSYIYGTSPASSG